ncbi:MAG: proteasome-activating nucleotidase, partial [Euryarchaeota archaeon]|nr:proteasome-activating nucleotidase [Euryarchaeota archaeon]
SGAELKATTVESGMIAIREGRSKVKQDDILLAVDRIKAKRETTGITSSPDALYG